MSSLRILLLSAFTFLASACAGYAPAPAARPPVQENALGSGLNTYLERTVPFGFSGVFLVAKNGEVILHGGYGLADREGGVPVTPHTVFDIGSITKQFTAAAILRLEEQGKLCAGDPITRFFQDVPADKRGITIHHLLTHTSGLPGDFGRDYEVMPRDSLMRLVLASELQWAPGARYDYSNAGYSMLGAIVEIASGQPYERYLHEHLFRPAGMSKTGYVLPTWTRDELAVGYRAGRRWGTPLDHAWAPDGPWWNLRANGGILSTLGDLHRWHRALSESTVLSESSLRKMFTPHAPESEDGRSHYGYGWAIFTTPRNTRLIAHNGGNGYFFADFHRYVDEDVVVLLATNASDQFAPMISARVIDAVFEQRPPALPPAAGAQLSEAELERYPGGYRDDSGARIVVSVVNGMLVADPIGQHTVDMLANIDADSQVELRELTTRSAAIMDAAERQDFGPLREASGSFDRSQAIMERIWKTAVENFGAFRSFEILGTVPTWWGEEEPSLATIVRLDFERGSRLFRLHWQNGRMVWFGGAAIPSPARTTLIPQGGHRFAGYNLGIEHTINMHFDLDGGRATSLRLEGPVGTIVLHRRD